MVEWGAYLLTPGLVVFPDMAGSLAQKSGGCHSKCLSSPIIGLFHSF